MKPSEGGGKGVRLAESLRGNSLQDEPRRSRAKLPRGAHGGITEIRLHVIRQESGAFEDLSARMMPSATLLWTVRALTSNRMQRPCRCMWVGGSIRYFTALSRRAYTWSEWGWRGIQGLDYRGNDHAMRAAGAGNTHPVHRTWLTKGNKTDISSTCC